MLTEKDLDALIASVSKEIDNAEALAKSAKDKPEPKVLKKDEKPAPPSEEEETAPAAPPSAEAAAEEPPAEAPAEEPAPEHDAAAPSPDEQPGEEQANMSDEDLLQIYDSMEPEELERHVMIAQQVLAHKQGAQPGAEGGAPPAPEAAPQAPPESMAMSEHDSAEYLAKAEETAKDIDVLKEQVSGLSKSVELLTQAIQAGFQPVRKSVAGVEFTERGGSETETKSLSKKELDAKLKELVKSPSLSKADRAAINEYYLDGGKNRSQMEKLVTGGK